jgi:tetratricopeptide (TPR) repeat protein
MHAVLAVFMLASALADDSDFAEGRRLYDSFEFEQAIFRFQQSALRSKAWPDEERAQVFFWLGLSYAGIGDFDAAERSFTDALRIDIEMPAPDGTSPRVLELLEKVRADVRNNPVEEPTPDDGPPPDNAVGDGGSSSSGEAGSMTPILLGAAGGAGALAAASFIGAGVFGVLIGPQLEIVQNPDSFQDEAKAAQDQANTLAIGAITLGSVGGVLLVAGGGLAAWALLGE